MTATTALVLLERLLEQHNHIIGVALGDHRCTCGHWDWHGDHKSHTAHLAQVIADADLLRDLPGETR